MTEIGTLKEALRRAARARSRALDPDQRQEASDKISLRLLADPDLERARRVAAYVAMADEVETRDLIGRIIALKGFVLLPRRRPEGGMPDLHVVRRFPDGHTAGSHGLVEPSPEVHPETLPPSEVDLFLVPGLAFDRTGRRLGRGGGGYDRLLAAASGARKIGLAFGFQILETPLPKEPHDVPMDRLITEEEVIAPESIRDVRS